MSYLQTLTKRWFPSWPPLISGITHYLNEQGIRYECLKLFGLDSVKKWAPPQERSSKPNLDWKIGVWLEKREVNGGPLKNTQKRQLSMDWRDTCYSRPTIQSSLKLQIFKSVLYVFAFKPITLKFSKHTNVWMLFPVTGLILWLNWF